MRGVAGIVTLAGLASFVQPGMESQISNRRPYVSIQTGGAGAGSPMGNDARKASVERIRRLSDERQKQLTADGVRLLAIATDLKAQVDSGEVDRRSDNVAHEAEQIGKLAHGIQEKMKATYTR